MTCAGLSRGSVPDGVLRALGLLLLAVLSRSRGSWRPERPMHGLVGLDGSPQAPDYAPISTPSPPWPGRSWWGSVRHCDFRRPW